jgi:hypothetical protein
VAQLDEPKAETSKNVHDVSELRNYRKLLAEVKVNNPVILADDNQPKYALVDLQELKDDHGRLFGDELSNSLNRAITQPTVPYDEIKKEFFE